MVDMLFWNGGFEAVFMIIFVLILVVFVVMVVRSIGEWMHNNESPRLTVEAIVVSKREHVAHHSHANAGDATGGHGFYTTTSTSYYVTFQVESGDRMEFHVSGSEYGMLAEHDEGKLSFQGSRYLGFERNAGA